LEKALKRDDGFEEWYAGVTARLAADPEFVYLKKARNHVVHKGALEILASHGFEMTDTPPRLQVRGFGPNGPELWAPNPAGDEGDLIPVDWRRLEGFRYSVDIRIAPATGLPAPPDRELKQMLAEKIEVLDAIVQEAGERFPGEEYDPAFDALMDDYW
jgi:hypothetical protein